MPPVDKSILSSKQNKDVSYLDELAFAVCVNGDSLEKYKKIVEKQFGIDTYANIDQFTKDIKQQVERQQFSNTSLLSLKYLGKNAGMSEETVDMIINHFKKKIYEEQQQREDNEYWNNCDHNDKHTLLEYAKKYPQGKYVKEAFAKINAINKEEKVKREETAYWNQCNPNDKRQLNEYLEKYPRGMYVRNAQNGIYNLCKDKKDYIEYLKRFPEGRYAKEAREKIKVFDDEEKSKREETVFWKQCSPNDKSRLQEYLRRYPDGMFVIRAKTFIADIDRIEKATIEENRMYNLCRTKADYMEYLRNYPNGLYKSQVQAKIIESDISATHECGTYAQEKNTYEQCKTKDDYLRYISLYPKGMYVRNAQNGIYNLCKDKKDYIDYLKRFPEGRYAKEAQDIINNGITKEKETERNNDKEKQIEIDDSKKNTTKKKKYDWICWICGGICAISGFAEGGISYAISAGIVGLLSSAFVVAVIDSVIEKIKR